MNTRSTGMTGSEQKEVDPVCKMLLGHEQIRESLVVGGQNYYFCSLGCRAEFQRHPEDYITRTSKGE
jgi:P-type Cu+ transporter